MKMGARGLRIPDPGALCMYDQFSKSHGFFVEMIRYRRMMCTEVGTKSPGHANMVLSEDGPSFV